MPFALSAKEPVAKGIRRLVVQRIDAAIGDIDDPAMDRHKAVHQVRRSCKKIRSVLRLVRGELERGDVYRTENAWYAEAARRLSTLRDTKAATEALERLERAAETTADREAVRRVADAVGGPALDDPAVRTRLDKELGEFRAMMVEGRGRVKKWPLRKQGFDAIEPGFKETYRRARKAMRVAFETGDTEAFHEWRKFTKHHLYHLRVLRKVWTPIIKRRQVEVESLAETLGDDHDLAVLVGWLDGGGGRAAGAKAIARVRALATARRGDLQDHARNLGQRVYAEKPGAITLRVRRYWQAWRKPGPARRREASPGAAPAARRALAQAKPAGR